jgi:hypothetical protein
LFGHCERFRLAAGRWALCEIMVLSVESHTTSHTTPGIVTFNRLKPDVPDAIWKNNCPRWQLI